MIFELVFDRMGVIHKEAAARLDDEQLLALVNEKFSEIWPDILLFFIIRKQKLNATLGNPLDAIIMQVICWHHFLLSIRETGEADDSTFDTALKLWSQYNNDGESAGVSKRLTFVAIERLTAIPFETVRRRVRGLEERGWVIIKEETGIDLNIESAVNQLIVEEVHPFEKQQFVKLLSKIYKLF